MADQETSIVRLGSEEMPWNMFMHTALFISMHIKGPVPKCLLDPVAYERNVAGFLSRAIRAVFPLKVDTEWLTLLAAMSYYECSDDRDRL